MGIYFLFLAFFLASPSSASAFDQSHFAFTKILKKYVVEEGLTTKVRYIELKKDTKELDSYLSSLEAVSKEEFLAFGADERLSFLINAYNAFTLRLVLNHYPVKSIKDIGGLFSSPWKKKFFRLLGEKKSLDNIEHDIIRKDFEEPRIHFAVNCASIGCPALRAEAYTARKLNEQLEDATKKFLQDKTRNRFKPQERLLEISSIFKWYGDDFRKKATLEAFLAQYMGETEEEKQLIRGESKTRYLSYDWDLNE